MSQVNPKAFPLANPQLTQQILDLVQQGIHFLKSDLTISFSLQDVEEGSKRGHKDAQPRNQRIHRYGS